MIRPQPIRSFSVLTYHSVGRGAQGSLSTADFAAQVRALAAMDDVRVLDWNRKHESLGDRICLVTFDDGYADNFTEAAPVLARHGIKALFFLTTAFLERERDITRTFRSYQGLTPMSWDQVGRLMEQGHAFGMHGHTHRDFGKLNEAEAREEFALSSEIFQKRLGKSPDSFAYPFGQFQHRRDELVDILKGTPLRYIFTTDHRLARPEQLKPGQGLVHIPRLRIDAGDTPAILAQKMRGGWDYVASIQRLQACIALSSLKPLSRAER